VNVGVCRQDILLVFSSYLKIFLKFLHKETSGKTYFKPWVAGFIVHLPSGIVSCPVSPPGTAIIGTFKPPAEQ